ncbi:hypothetical protein PCASD_04852 [Puccinia coronata f. sp. avenae]|uniref:C2H2-type domain-containing protein n=1 Tax=Puccinia coronata f. sp. avenae TaxID=200324 RepID=A0A2N5V267_9BASI|nr:hypothetical protein PCASD_04852 [Puccinia coronata f. sp. avenae]
MHLPVCMLVRVLIPLIFAFGGRKFPHYNGCCTFSALQMTYADGNLGVTDSYVSWRCGVNGCTEKILQYQASCSGCYKEITQTVQHCRFHKPLPPTPQGNPWDPPSRVQQATSAPHGPFSPTGTLEQRVHGILLEGSL